MLLCFGQPRLGPHCSRAGDVLSPAHPFICWFKARCLSVVPLQADRCSYLCCSLRAAGAGKFVEKCQGKCCVFGSPRLRLLPMFPIASIPAQTPGILAGLEELAALSAW